MAYIPQDVIEQVQRSVDIVDVVRSYFPLKRSGRNFTALCPFHTEKTPSFSVNPQKQIFKCFGCGKAGDAFGFVMAMERVEFPQAVRVLAERAGIILPETRTPEAQARRELREQLWKLFGRRSEEARFGPPRSSRRGWFHPLLAVEVELSRVFRRPNPSEPQIPLRVR